MLRSIELFGTEVAPAVRAEVERRTAPVEAAGDCQRSVEIAMRLSVLDQSPIPEGSTGADALHNTLDLAQLADELGYHRYWVAEHHGGPMLASASPEALIGPIAAATAADPGRQRRRDAAPLQPVQGRRDVHDPRRASIPGGSTSGSAAPSGTDPLTTFALQRDRREASPDDFPQQLAELIAYFDDSLPEDHPFRHLAATLPGRPGAPAGVAARFLAAERDLGRPARAPVRVRRLHQPRGSGRSRAVPRAVRARRAFAARRGPRWPPGSCAPTPTRRPSIWPRAAG